MPSKSYAKDAVRRGSGRDIPELLTDLYVTRRHSQAEIAVALGVSRELIRTWLREYRISRADRAPIEGIEPLGATA